MYKEKLDKILLNVQKPARYIGGEIGSVSKAKDKIDLRFAFCFPDTYEIGMSHLGLKILYALKNNVENYWCERVFMPLPDMQNEMRKNNILLYGLESLEPICEFDFIGFTLQYELTYTNILAMLDLAGLPLLAKERKGLYPIVIGGGPCACNPEPLADFFDLFIIGEGEEVTLELLKVYENCKKDKLGKSEFLEKAAGIKGVYVPSLYEISYNSDGFVKEILNQKNACFPVKKRIINNFDSAFIPKEFVVPFCETVHDRAVTEVLRGCIRGCRFCQAGFIYRPFRERSAEKILENVSDLCENAGYDEVSLSSLSTGDYHNIEGLLKKLTGYTSKRNINLSLPSMRIDSFSNQILQQIKSVRKSGLTFAPEAGTARLRKIINKNITEEDILKGCKIAFEGGYSSVKLYFMLGLPGETDEDILGIKLLTDKIIDLYYSLPNRNKGKQISISITLSTFIPKPFTPFEFEPQLDREEIIRRRKYLLSVLKNKKIRVSWSDYDESVLEAALARGDRRLAQVILKAFQNGCFLDGWEEYFDFEKWEKAFSDCGLDMAFYAGRTRNYDEIPPWAILDMLVDREFLIEENKLAHQEITTLSCREKCAACGVSKQVVGACIKPLEQMIPENNLYENPIDVKGQNKSIRIFFKKINRAKYISHLDLQKTMQRALKRAGLPVWETEGFNPHIYLTFALPLSLGIESLCESFDIKITEEISFEEIHKRLNDALTEDLQIIKVAEPIFKPAEIQKAEYKITVETEKFSDFSAQNEIIITKKTKKGETQLDIKPLIEFKEITDNQITLILPAGNALNLNPIQVMNTFAEFSGEDSSMAQITRIAIFCSDGQAFN